MRIFIAGAGAVGTHLAKLLAKEKQDIILIDDDEDRLAALSSSYDLMAVVGSPTSIEKLKEYGAGKADLFIAVTPDESRNITACILAGKLGAKKTVARIDNEEYLKPEYQELFKNLGIDSMIFPEELAAEEIITSLKMSWVRQWWEFADGALILVGAKIRENAEILDTPLYKLGGPNMPYHIVAIQRGNDETIIPGGQDIIRLNDIVYFTTTRQHISYIRKLAGKEKFPDVKNIMFMGASSITARTILNLPTSMRGKVLEKNAELGRQLSGEVGGKTMVINGDARDADLLKSEGLNGTQAFVALTDNSETNILACLAAKRMGVSKVIAEVENIDYIGMAESMDIGTVINKKLIAASHIFQLMLNADVSNVKCLTFADADVAEFVVKKGARVTETTVRNIGLPKGTTIGGLIRNGEGLVVTGDTQIQAGDHVVVFCLSMMIKKIEKYFN